MHDKHLHLDCFQSFATEILISQESVMDSFVVSLYASLSQVIGQIIFSVSWKFSHICGREVFTSWWRILELTEGPMFFQWNLDWPLFLSRDARMCNGRCLHSSMIGMLCTPFWGPSRTVQKALRCPRPESSVLTLDWAGCRLGFVVDLVEEHVGLGGSRSSWPFYEHESSELVSQHNMAIQVFGNQCSPRVQHWLLVTWLVTCVTADNELPRSIMICFVSNVEVCAFMRGTCLETPGSWFASRPTTGCSVLSCAVLSSTLKLFLSSDERVWETLGSWFVSRPTTGCSVLSRLTASSWKERVSISWERDVSLPPCAVLGSSPTTGCPFLSWSGFGFDWVNWELVNCCTTCPSGRWAAFGPNSFIQSCFKEILGGGRGDANTFSYMTSPFSILTTFGIQ